jgi:hypothetical protein
MTPEELEHVRQMADESIKAAMEADRLERESAEATAKAEAERTEAAVKAALDAQAKEFAKQFAPGRRLSDAAQHNANLAPYVTAFSDTRKYDNLTVADQAFLCGILDASKQQRGGERGVSKSALKALAIKIAEDKSEMGEAARSDLKAAGLDPADVTNSVKANELDYSTQSGFGDEWVGVEYSRRLWEAIRSGTFVADRIPSIEVPQGAESIIIPLEAADQTWYKVAQTTATNATTLRPDATVPTSKLATANKTLTVGKMGARTIWANELEEDSLIPWVAQLRSQMEKSGAENLEATIIDGDTAAGATTNINDIGGTPAATDLFLLFDGLRKSPLVTTTANSRSAGGSLVDTDFIETVKLMGVGGLNGTDVTKTSFIVDINTNWKIFSLASVKTKDVFTGATLENGMLKGIWGYKVDVSYFMHFQSAARKANTAGKVDRTTPSNNTTGSILAVRWDQWLLGYKRRMTIKLQDIPDSDAQQIVAIARVGLAQRDTEASAITYNVGV